MIELTIDGLAVAVPKGTTILDAALTVDIDIPTFCYDRTLGIIGACRMCSVEIEGIGALRAACATEVSPGMVVHTESEAVVETRRILLDLLLSDHPLDCLTCEKAGACSLQEYCYRYGVEETSYEGERKQLEIDSANHLIERDQNKCILCGKCVAVCQSVQVTNAIDFSERGFEAKVATSFDHPLEPGELPLLRQCVDLCPTGALTNKQLKGTRTWERTKVRTTCPFCGVGCNFDLNVADGKVVGVTANPDVARQHRLAVRQGTLPHRPDQQPGPHHHAAHQARRRLRAGELGRGARPRGHAPHGDQERARRRGHRCAELRALHQRGELPPAEAHARGS